MKRILLVEPDKVLSRLYKNALELKDYKVKSVTNAQEAVNSSDKSTPDLVIIEIQLVSHSGIEFLYEFRSYPEWQKVPVIVLSLVPVMEFSDNYSLLKKELNITSYLYKPSTTLKILMRETEKALSNASKTVH